VMISRKVAAEGLMCLRTEVEAEEEEEAETVEVCLEF
jgi:hypothetical protein